MVRIKRDIEVEINVRAEIVSIIYVLLKTNLLKLEVLIKNIIRIIVSIINVSNGTKHIVYLTYSIIMQN